jgi:hypothetical protein
MELFVRMIIIAVNMTLHNNILVFHSNSYIILICVMCLWPGLVVDTRYVFSIKDTRQEKICFYNDVIRKLAFLNKTVYSFFIINALLPQKNSLLSRKLKNQLTI